MLTFLALVHMLDATQLKATGTQCIDRKWQSLKNWIPKELRNKQKFTRDLNESIRDYVFAFVCQMGKRKHVEKPSRLGFQVLSPKKKSVSETRAIQFYDGTQ